MPVDVAGSSEEKSLQPKSPRVWERLISSSAYFIIPCCFIFLHELGIILVIFLVSMVFNHGAIKNSIFVRHHILQVFLWMIFGIPLLFVVAYLVAYSIKKTEDFFTITLGLDSVSGLFYFFCWLCMWAIIPLQRRLPNIC
jgi:hypothetical protein